MLQASVAGLLSGGAYAMLGVCVVMLYRMTGVLNISQGAVGAFGAMVTVSMSARDWPFAPSLVVGMAAASLVAAVMGGLISRFYRQCTAEVRTVLTAALLVGLFAIGFRLFGNNSRAFPSILAGNGYRVAAVVISANAFLVLLAAVVLAVGVGAVLQRTRWGILLRAMSSHPVTAEMLGVPVTRLVILVWAAMGAVTTVAVVAIAPTRPSNFINLSMLILPALAAALLGGLRHLGLTVLGGVVIGVLEGAGTSVAAISQYRQLLPFVVVLACLLWMQRKEVWDAAR